MRRLPCLLGCAILCFGGCTATPPHFRVVSTSQVVRAEPQPVTAEEFQGAEQDGQTVVATGQGAAWGMDDRSIRLSPGERLHVLTFNPRSGCFVVRRIDAHALARVEPAGLEALTTRDSS